MAAPGLTIPTSFTAKGDYISQVNRMANATDRMIGSVSRLNSIGPQLSTATKNILGYAKSALLVGGAFATAKFSSDAIMDYETSIQSLQAVTGSGDAAMVGFKKQIEELGGTSKKSMVDIAKSFETVGSMMSQYLDDPKALRMITDAGITLSKASRMELEPAMQSLTSVMNQFQIGAEGANKTIQTLTAGEIVGAVRTSEASQYLQEFGAVAKNMGVNVGESIALIEALGMQLKSDKIGVGARNILTSIGAAGGLDKKARADMKAAGVDMKFLMNSSNSLSARLHELSKIGKDPIKMISVFGKENVTAASVIFNQLGTYDKFYAKIQTTAEAENQAATNSRTFANALDQLKNRWANLLNSSSKVTGVLDKFREGLFWVADHMEDILSVGGKLITGFLIWKGVVLATNVALKSYSIFLGIQNALMLESTLLVEGNAVAKAASIITEKAMAAAIAISTGNWAALNAVMAANPIGLVVVGLTALVAGLGYAYNRTQELTQAYKDNIAVQMTSENTKQLDSVKKLALEYHNMGQSIKSATENAIKFKMVGIAEKRFKAESEIKNLKQQLDVEKNKLYGSDILAGTFGYNNDDAGQRGVIAEKLLAKQHEAALLAQQAQTTVGFAKQEQDAGVIGGMSLGKFIQPFQSVNETAAPKFTSQNTFAGQYGMSEQRKNLQSPRIPQTQEMFDKQRMEIVIKNDGSTAVDVKSGKTGAKSVMPNTKSSFSTN
jgi:TP901 family phage tail tape measure protein